jgi:hypothetical protein
LSIEDILAFEEEHIKEGSESSPEVIEPVRALTMSSMSQTFKLFDSKHDTNLLRSSKVWREIENALKCYKEH